MLIFFPSIPGQPVLFVCLSFGVFVNILGLPFLFVTSVSLYSKITRPESQGQYSQGHVTGIPRSVLPRSHGQNLKVITCKIKWPESQGQYSQDQMVRISRSVLPRSNGQNLKVSTPKIKWQKSQGQYSQDQMARISRSVLPRYHGQIPRSVL